MCFTSLLGVEMSHVWLEFLEESFISFADMWITLEQTDSLFLKKHHPSYTALSCRNIQNLTDLKTLIT